VTRLLPFVALSAICALAQPETIRDVDFRNLTYPHRVAEYGPSSVRWRVPTNPSQVRLRDGRWAEPDQGPIFSGLTLEETLFGDLTGEGGEEAIAVLRYDRGGTMTWHVLYLFAWQGNSPKVIAVLHAGDRSDRGLSHVVIENGQLVVELYDPTLQTGLCCSSGILRTRYQWNGRTFRRVGPVVRAKAKSVSRRPVNVFGMPVER
jgi:hypothetical protein